MESIFENLNEKQSQAVRATEGYVRVIAGAGSGKTKLLVSRYAYLVKDYGIDSANILCVTFTNKAAGEMRRRIRALIGPEYDTSLICTYHGFCARLLREDPQKLFLNRGFDILDLTRQKELLGEIYQRHELKLDYASFESMLKRIGTFKSELSYVERMCSPSQCPIMPDISTLDDLIMEEFMQKQKAIYALDFDDLMNFALYLLINDEELRGKWQDRLNYIQVDEFQDSSRREMRLVDILSAGYQNLMIVGDPDQNIYEWRGSDVMLLVDFDKTHAPVNTLFLNRNYRSTPEILGCANTLIDKNELRIKKDLYTDLTNGAPVVHFHSGSDAEEVNRITDTIRDIRRESGLSYSDFAILYRSGFLSRAVEKKLVESGIPYEIYGGVKFYSRMEVRDIIAYLRLIAYDDDIAFKRIVNTPRRRFGRSKLACLEALKEESGKGKSLFALLCERESDSPFSQSDIKGLITLVNETREFAKSARISEIVEKVCAQSGYESYIRELGDEERLENLAEFKRVADEFEKNFGENLTLCEFLQQIALQSSENEEKGRDCVKLMTVHASKGLEFPVVFLIGLSEGIFPSSKTIEQRKKAGLEEERRLCYVAITRAMRRLFLMDSEGFSQNGIKKLPSRFLWEIGRENYLRVDEISKELEQESFAYIAKTSLPFEDGKRAALLDIGNEVEHHAFGHGVIIAVDEKRNSLTVRFDSLPRPRNISADYFVSGPKRENGARELAKPSTIIPLPQGSMSESGRPLRVLEGPTPEAEKSTALPEVKETESAKALSKGNPAPVKGQGQNAPPALLPQNIQVENFDEIGTSNIKETDQTEQNKTVKPIEQIEPAEPAQPTQPTEPAEQAKQEQSDLPQSFVAELYEESEAKGSVSPDQKEGAHQISDDLRQKLSETDNLWKRDDVPHSGWSCVGIIDLCEPVGVCEMCGYQIIRYVHKMAHPQYQRMLGVGCVCAGRMEGSPEAARKRERDFKNRSARYENYKKRKWRTSGKGNSYLKIRNHIIVLFPMKGGDKWGFSLDGVFSESAYPSKESASDGAFDALCRAENK